MGANPGGHFAGQGASFRADYILKYVVVPMLWADQGACTARFASGTRNTKRKQQVIATFTLVAPGALVVPATMQTAVAVAQVAVRADSIGESNGRRNPGWDLHGYT